MEINLGPFALRVNATGENWTNIGLSYVSNRNGGKAQRETGIRAGFKSEHAIDLLGKDLPSDTFICPTTGTTYYGKIVMTPTGAYVIPAKDVYTKTVYEKACREGLRAAESATFKVGDTIDADTTDPGTAPA